MSNLNLSINIGAVDQASQVFRSVGTAFKSLASGDIVGASLVAGTAIAAIGGTVIKMTADYEQSMNKVQALTGASTDQMQQFDAGLKSLSTTTGVVPKQLADGLYNVVSAGYQGKDAMTVLELATKDSVIGMTNASVTTKSLAALLAQFSLGAKDATRVNGEMLETVTLGSGTFEQYSSSIVKAASSASQFHESMETMNAAYATLTSNQINAAQASTDFQQSLKVMDGNIGAVSKSLSKSGIAFDEAKFNAMDYGHKVVYLNTALDEANAKHIHVTGITLQAAQAVSTIAQHIGTYNKDLATLSDKQAMGQKTQEAWTVTQQGFNVSMQRLQAAVDVLMISIGTNLLPVLGQIAAAVTTGITAFSNWIVTNHVLADASQAVKTAIDFVKTAINDGKTAVQNIEGAIKSVISWFKTWGPVILSAASPIIAFFIPALIKAGVEAVVNGVKIAANFIKSLITTGVEAVVNGAKLTVSFVQSMIKAGIEAVVNGAKITANFIKSLIQTGVEGWQAAGKMMAFIGNMIKAGVEAVIAGAKVAASFVANMVKAGAEAVVAGAKIVANFVGSMLAAGAQAALAGIKIVASFVASLITTGIQAIISAGIMLSTLVPSLLATAAAALAATWPFLLIAAVVAVVVIGVILAIQHWAQIMAWLQGVLQAFWGWIVGLGNGIVNVWNNLKSGVVGALQGLWNFINGFFGGLPGQALQWGIGIIQGFINGIKNMLGAVGNAASSVVNTVKNFLGFHSPAKEGPGMELDLWPRNMVASYAKGLQAGVPQIQAAMNLLVKPLAVMGQPAHAGVSGPVAAPAGASGGGGGVNNFYITLQSAALSKRDASQLADQLVDEISKKTRRSGNLVTWTSGGKFG